MLENSLLDSQSRAKTRKPFTLVVSVAAHVVTVATLVLAPLARTQALPIPPVDISLLSPRLETPRPNSAPATQPRIQRVVDHPVGGGAFTAPQIIPSQVAYVDGKLNVDFPVPVEFRGIGGSGTASRLLGSLFGDEPAVTAPSGPPLPPPPPGRNAKPIRVSGGAEGAVLIHQVSPVYPEIAKRTRTQGVVVLEAVISKSGSIDSLRVISGHPLLRQSAINAVKEWRYRPTMLNSEPVEVITTVTVTFSLSGL